MDFISFFNDLNILIKSETEKDYKLYDENYLRKKYADSCFIKKFFVDYEYSSNVIESITWWQYVEHIIYKLLLLNEGLEEDTLISISHKGILKASCKRLINIAILPHLAFQVPQWKGTQTTGALSTEQRDQIIFTVTSFLVYLCESNGVFKEVLSSELGSIMAGLLHILFFLKTPPKERDIFKLHLTTILDSSHQPTIVKELMILNCSKGDNGKVCRVIRQILMKKLTCQGGVLTLLRAVLTEGASTCDLVKLAQLITNDHSTPSYYEQVLPQLLPLLLHDVGQIRQVVAQCFGLLQEKHPDICERFLIVPLLTPLRVPSSEQSIENCLRSVDNLFGASTGGVAPWVVARQLYVPLGEMYSAIYESPCNMKQTVSKLLLQCLHIAPNIGEVIPKILFPEKSQISFRLGGSGGLVAEESDEDPSWDVSSNSLLRLISDSPKLKYSLYTSLLEFTSSDNIHRKIISTNLLSSLSTDSDILKALSSEPSPILHFLTHLLTPEEFVDTEALTLGLVVLNIIVCDKLMYKKRNWKLFDQLVEPLKNVKARCKEGELRVLADEVLCTLMSRGIVGKSVATKSDLNVIRAKEEKSDYEAMILQLNDPLLPVRAHAIRQLGKLISRRDKTALLNREIIFSLFKENLKDEDSYMYLSCIEGLSCLSAEFPSEVLSTLCDQFAHSASPEIRLKIGETLLKTTRNLGEMSVVYKRELINTFLGGCRDKDHLVRASSLSNLGELCKILSFRITSFLVEIFDCIQATFATDRELEPRRAAVMVVALLLKGLDSKTFSVLETVLLDLYRQLKLIYETEKDDVTKLHAQLSLEVLRSCTISFLFPKETFVKKISFHQ